MHDRMVSRMRQAEPAPGGEDPRDGRAAGLRGVSVLIGISIFVTVFANHTRLGKLPLRAIIKDELSLPPDAMASFFALAGLAWYLKPLAGALSDYVPIFGTRRRHYLLMSAFGGAAVWAATAVVPRTYHHLLIAMVALNVMVVVGNTAVGGLLVDSGRAHSATGRLSALRVTVMNGASLATGPVGGWLAGRAFGLTCTVGALLLVAMAMCVGLLLREEAQPQGEAATRLGSGRLLLQHLRSRVFWSVALITFVFYAAPGFQSALYYHQKDTLGLTDQQIGLLGALNCVGGMLGALCYTKLCSRLRMHSLLLFGIGLTAGCSLLYLGYRTQVAAIALEGIAGFLGILGLLPLQDLAVRASPPRSEALGYALLLSIGNAAIALSDVVGTRLMMRLGVSLQGLIWINAAAAAALVLALPLLPRDLLREREGAG